MKSPSKNMSASLRKQSPGGREGMPIEVGKQRPPSMAGAILPGEHGVEAPPGEVHSRSAAHYAPATGSHFGDGKM